MNKLFEMTNEDGSKIINYTDRIEMYDTNNKLCGILGNLDSYEELQKKAELGEHYKHLYSEVKKQKDDVVEYIKENKNKTIAPYGDNEDTDYEVCLFEEDINDLLRMLGEINE